LKSTTEDADTTNAETGRFSSVISAISVVLPLGLVEN
jgi:hypothetical protein